MSGRAAALDSCRKALTPGCLLNGHPSQRLSLHTQLNRAGIQASWPDIPAFFGVDGKYHDTVRAAAIWLQDNIPRMYEQSEYARR